MYILHGFLLLSLSLSYSFYLLLNIYFDMYIGALRYFKCVGQALQLNEYRTKEEMVCFINKKQLFTIEEEKNYDERSVCTTNNSSETNRIVLFLLFFISSSFKQMVEHLDSCYMKVGVFTMKHFWFSFLPVVSTNIMNSGNSLLSYQI